MCRKHVQLDLPEEAAPLLDMLRFALDRRHAGLLVPGVLVNG